MLYNRLPISTSKQAAETANLRKEVLRLKKELASISAQDEFTRWAKLRRQHDKAVGEYDKIGMLGRDVCRKRSPTRILTMVQRKARNHNAPDSTQQQTHYDGLGLRG